MSTINASSIIPFTIEEVPNRSEFWRDAEAASRLSNPKTIRRFLGELIQVRAHDEAAELQAGGRIVEAKRQIRVNVIARQLVEQCRALGLFDSGRILHYTIETYIADLDR